MRMSLGDQLNANFHSHGGAFDRLRDRLGIKSATAKSRQLFAVVYQSCVDQIVNQMIIEAEYKRKRTLTMDMASHAFERITGQKIYATDYGSRRVTRHHKNAKAKSQPQELGVSRSLKAKPAPAGDEPDAEAEEPEEPEAEDADMPEA